MNTRILTLSAVVGSLVLLMLGGLYYMSRPVASVQSWGTVATIAPQYQAAGSEPQLSIPEGRKLYRNEKYNFKLAVPEDLQVSEDDEPGGLTVVFMNENKTRAFQIFATPYVGHLITEERLKMDLPGGKFENPIEVLVDGARGTIFFSTDESVGETREVWFIHGDYLYEVTAPKQLDEWISGIVSTWRFLKAPQNKAIMQ